MERSVPVIPCGTDIGTPVHQQPGNIDATTHYSSVERRRAIMSIHGIGIGTPVHQKSSNIQETLICRYVKRRLAIFCICFIDIGAPVHNPRHAREIAFHHCFN